MRPLKSDSNDSSDVNAVKYGRNYLLMNGAQLVAAGKECKSLTTVHGDQVNLETHSILQVESVLCANYVPQEFNPNEEPLSPGQFNAWRRDSLTEDEDVKVIWFV